MKHFLSTCLLLCWSVVVVAQPKLIKRIPIKADYISVDNLSNAYTVKADLLVKFDKDGNRKQTYSNKVLGTITSMDASNPLKLLLFYQGLTQISFLDNRLSPRGSAVALEDLELFQATLSCTSHSSGVWIYDRSRFQLTRLDQTLQVVRQTGNLNQVLNTRINPNFLFEANSWVYLNDPAVGVLVFDIYGTYYKTIPLKGLTWFKIHDGSLYYQKEGKVIGFHLKTLEEKQLTLPDTKFKAFNLAERRLYLLKEDVLEIYSRE